MEGMFDSIKSSIDLAATTPYPCEREKEFNALKQSLVFSCHLYFTHQVAALPGMSASALDTSSHAQQQQQQQQQAQGSNSNNEDELRQQLRHALQQLKRREPLEPTYKRLLMDGTVTTKRPVLPKDKFYKRVSSRLRERVEHFLHITAGKDPMDRLRQRQPLQDEAMRAAFTLREAKEHEQLPLLESTLNSLPRRRGMDDLAYKKYFDGIASFLQSRDKPSASSSLSRSLTPVSAMEKTEHARQQAELERQRAEAQARETARRRREEEARAEREREMQRSRHRPAETPQHALHKLYYPIFKKLWDMEFAHIANSNPFRMVIDRDNCVAVGAPDYFDVVKKPMNLTYIQTKVDNMEYESLSAFFADVELMISNAILYNSNPSNPYRIAAEEMKKRYGKMVKYVLQTIQNKQQQQQGRK